jgi:uncharacterized tellurite resistance protein B-like protein
MLKRLFRVFAPDPAEGAPSAERIPLAAAVLLLEVAHSDGHFHPEEERLIGQLLQQYFALGEAAVADLLLLAETTRKNSHDLHQFTREINRAFSQAEKERIIRTVWQLVYADGRLDRFEEALMRQLGSLIGVSHRQLIEAKLDVSRQQA